MHVGGTCLPGRSARPETVLHDRAPETDLELDPDTGSRVRWLQGTCSGAGGRRSGRGKGQFGKRSSFSETLLGSLWP